MKKVWRAVKYLLLAAVLLIALDVAVVIGFAKFQPQIGHADAIVVLGAAINSPALNNRVLAALNLYQNHKADVMVLSGGKIAAPDISEAEYMRRYINKQHLTEAPKLIIEDQSHNTEENIKNTRATLPGKQSLIIVSDEFHLARAVLLAKREGFSPVYWMSPQPTYYTKAELLRYYVREMVAMIRYIPVFIFSEK